MHLLLFYFIFFLFSFCVLHNNPVPCRRPFAGKRKGQNAGRRDGGDLTRHPKYVKCPPFPKGRPHTHTHDKYTFLPCFMHSRTTFAGLSRFQKNIPSKFSCRADQTFPKIYWCFYRCKKSFRLLFFIVRFCLREQNNC